jgi:hypothetical protein
MQTRGTTRLRALAVTLLAALLLPAGARAEPQPEVEPPRPGLGVMVFDVLVVRPLGLIVLPVAAAAFIPAALLSAPGGKASLQEAYERFVRTPASYVFVRPLGEV